MPWRPSHKRRLRPTSSSIGSRPSSVHFQSTGGDSPYPNRKLGQLRTNSTHDPCPEPNLWPRIVSQCGRGMERSASYPRPHLRAARDPDFSETCCGCRRVTDRGIESGRDPTDRLVSRAAAACPGDYRIRDVLAGDEKTQDGDVSAHFGLCCTAWAPDLA